MWRWKTMCEKRSRDSMMQSVEEQQNIRTQIHRGKMPENRRSKIERTFKTALKNLDLHRTPTAMYLGERYVQVTTTAEKLRHFLQQFAQMSDQCQGKALRGIVRFNPQLETPAVLIRQNVE